jgi:subtilisin family serine protease
VRKALVLTAAVALALTMTVPVTAAGAAPDTPVAAAPGTKAVPESPSGSYIVVMKQDPLVTSVDASQLASPEARAQAATLEATHDAVLAAAGSNPDAKVQDYTNALNGFSAVVSHEQAIAMAANPQVAKVLPDELRQLTREVSTATGSGSRSGTAPDDLGRFLGLTGRGSAWASGVTGRGVVVGVIDSGIWPEHPSFADNGNLPAAPTLPEAEDSDGNVRSTCDFGNTAANPEDAPFTCTNKLIGARQMIDTYRALIPIEPFEFDSARDEDGHGTHTASTAAGNASVQAAIFGRKVAVISGIAPDAHVIAYKGLGPQGGFTSDLAGSIDQAVADGVDVINYSIGGGPTTVSADTLAFLFAADAGVFSAVSAGNSGPGPETLGGPADVPWVTAVGANTMTRSFQGTIKLEGGPTLRGASVTLGTVKHPLVDGAAAGSELCLPEELDPTKVTGAIVLCKRGTNGRVDKSLSVLNAGGAGMILYNTTDADDLNTDNFFVPTVMVDNTTGLRVKQYLATRPNPKADLDTGQLGTLRFAPSMTLFSSRGPNPTSADVIKPDITAPGIQILAGNTPMPEPGTQPAGELFQAIAGTSMSSPVVAGVYALIKQAHPEWSAAAAKSAIMTTANTKVKDNDKVSQAGPFAMGSGMVNPGKVASKGSPFNPGIVYDAGFTEYLGFLCDEGPEAFVNPEATCAALAGAGIPTEATGLNLSSIGIAELAGTQTVTRTVTSVADKAVSWRASITAPPGYRVSVSPQRFTLQPGESASYQLTITNKNAALGEWFSGSISWTGSPARSGPHADTDAAAAIADVVTSGSLLGFGHGGSIGGRYQVRSPIAVRGVALTAPATLSGTGESGTASVDVTFGYTGAYTAGAHGLVAPAVTDGTIDQDPDQTYIPGDTGAGIVEVPVDVVGTALARWSLVIPGDADLDLYLLNPAGELIAQSTNGGTDELIELTLPADGEYTLAIHGWAVPVAPLAFSLDNWLVPLATGGSLSVTDAPVSATSGATGTVGVSWSGLTAGTPYLGAISHSDESGVLALTVVDVTG